MSYNPNEYRRDDTRREQEDLRETQSEDYTPAEMAQRMAIYARQMREQTLPAILTGTGVAAVFGLGSKS